MHTHAPASETACTPCPPTGTPAHLCGHHQAHKHTRARAHVHAPHSFARNCDTRVHGLAPTQPMDTHTGTPANTNTQAQADVNTDKTAHASTRVYVRTQPHTGAHAHGCTGAYTTPACRDAHRLMHVMRTPTCSHTRTHEKCPLLSAPMSLRSSANRRKSPGVAILRLQINERNKKA